MDKTIFYVPDIASTLQLSEEESSHCVKVLRKKSGDPILVTDGRGQFFEALVSLPHPKHTTVQIVAQTVVPKPWKPFIHIAFAPTKNMDRTEWFVEKATEIGIDVLTPLLTRFSERREIKAARIEKILVSAMKQSCKATLPTLQPMIAFEQFVKQPFDGHRFIAHCHPGEKTPLATAYESGQNVQILIGPEGDFSPPEIEAALCAGFRPVSLGQSRLRTETAALAACHTIHVVNQANLSSDKL